MIAIVDYGRGNLTSVANAFAALGVPAAVTGDPAALERADAVVLPGVGEFSDAMRTLGATGLDGAIRRAVDSGKPFLGICLGYQMLFERSEEGGDALPGLGVFRGSVKRFPADTGLKVPHMGWNRIEFEPGAPAARPVLFRELPDDGAYMYFVHSFYPDPADPAIVSARTGYGVRFASAVSRGNVHGVQFHPEKSGDAGLAVLRAFAATAGEVRPC